jgi:hypothetical protein
MVCCQAVNKLKSIVARPVTVAALTERKRASMYGMLFLPLEAHRMAAEMRGTNVLQRESVKVAAEHQFLSQNEEVYPEEVEMVVDPAKETSPSWNDRGIQRRHKSVLRSQGRSCWWPRVVGFSGQTWGR